MSNRENPSETGRIAAYRFLLGALVPSLGRDKAAMMKAAIRQVLRGDELVRLHPTIDPERTYAASSLGASFFPLSKNLGGFGEGLRAGLKECLDVITEQYPNSD